MPKRRDAGRDVEIIVETTVGRYLTFGEVTVKLAGVADGPEAAHPADRR